MNYKDYQNSRDMAWKILLQENVTELPVNVIKLCKQLGVRVQSYVPVDDNDGFSVIIRGKPRIFVSEKCSKERQRFTIAHELGHILLGHVGEYELVNREPDPKDNPIEQAANVFASRLLAPACVLWALNTQKTEEIAALCKISYQAASFRAERMALLYQRNKFLVSPLERAVYRQFEEFIRSKEGGSL